MDPSHHQNHVQEEETEEKQPTGPTFSQEDLDALNKPVESVSLDGLVVMKMVKHCRETLPSLVTGQLLGMDVDGVLEVTNAFPFPSRSADDVTAEAGAAYQIEMMRCLRDVHIDHNAVGWYQSVYLGSYINQTLIQTQFSYQQHIPQSIVIVYDPIRSSHGTLAMKALRLSEKFMTLYAGSKRLSMEQIAKADLSFRDIFTDLPLQISTSTLGSLLAHGLELNGDAVSSSVSPFNVLNRVNEQYLEKQVELLMESFDAKAQEQYKWNRYQQSLARQQQSMQHALHRRKMENQRRAARGLDPLPEEEVIAMYKTPTEPSQLDNLMVLNQMSQYCRQIQEFTGGTISKLYCSEQLPKL